MKRPTPFRAWRKKMGYTQDQAARELGLSLRMVRYYEKGEREDGRSVDLPRTVILAMRCLELEPPGSAPAPTIRWRA